VTTNSYWGNAELESNPPRNSHIAKPWRFGSLPDSRFLLLASACFINAVLAVMGDLLFTGSRVVSPEGGGIDARFASLRAFTFDQIAAGEIPLWNPHIFAGSAHIGGFESGAYYPLSLVHLVLPLTAALNVEVALHLFLCALFTYVWLRKVKIHPCRLHLRGLAAMYSGAFYARAMSGDFSVMTSFTWLPVALIATFDSKPRQAWRRIPGPVVSRIDARFRRLSACFRLYRVDGARLRRDALQRQSAPRHDAPRVAECTAASCLF
jgi:hypothetical protein